MKTFLSFLAGTALLGLALTGCGDGEGLVSPGDGKPKDISEAGLIGHWAVVSIFDKGTSTVTLTGKSPLVVPIDTAYYLGSTSAWTYTFAANHSYSTRYDTLSITGTWSLAGSTLTMISALPSGSIDTAVVQMTLAGDSASMKNSYDFSGQDSIGTRRDVFEETLKLGRLTGRDTIPVDTIPADTTHYETLTEAKLLGKWHFDKETAQGYYSFTPTAGSEVRVPVDTVETYAAVPDYFIRFDAGHTYLANFPGDSTTTLAKRGALAKVGRLAKRATQETGTWSLSGNTVTTVSAAGDTTRVIPSLLGTKMIFTISIRQTFNDTDGVYKAMIDEKIFATKQ